MLNTLVDEVSAWTLSQKFYFEKFLNVASIVMFAIRHCSQLNTSSGVGGKRPLYFLCSCSELGATAAGALFAICKSGSFQLVCSRAVFVLKRSRFVAGYRMCTMLHLLERGISERRLHALFCHLTFVKTKQRKLIS